MPGTTKSELFRKLPSVDELVHRPTLALLTADPGSVALTDAARAVLDRLRQEISSGLLDAQGLDVALSSVGAAVEEHLRRTFRPSLRRVINATGVILHTNLGRAPLSEATWDHIRETSAAYSNLEFDLETGRRSKRDVHVERLLQRLLGDEAGKSSLSTIVVNNNAAAVLLALNTLGDGGEVIVSRGELVEIGDSFRIPDVMGKSGAILREVGTTNRTRIADYESAINERTRLLLRVHRSNFAISGFTEQPSIPELVDLSHKRGLPLMEDLGSGALLDLESVGISGEPSILDRLRCEVDIVTYSGDKLLGGPQAGLISGRRELVTRMRSNPLFRALRVDKLTYGALEATLLAYVARDHDSIPALRMMRLTKDKIGQRAREVAGRAVSARVRVEVVEGESVIGGGAAPSAVLPTFLLALSSDDLSPDDLANRLRGSDPPIVARVEVGRVLLDLRTVLPAQDALVVTALNRIAM